MSILQQIQSELKAPKGQKNNFGNYSYRSAEDILSAVKPLLQKHEVSLIISDDIVGVEGRVYVQATATLWLDDKDCEPLARSTGFAREALTKKGMDDAQITGSASSYARKYALNGLLCIDDTKDPDATNTHGKGEPSYKKKTQTLDGLI
jgi:hypothetical protein|tara:strand:+ start:59 stop:505 length:447 start_codon:yes stop_codon:yes gene_type:complete